MTRLISEESRGVFVIMATPFADDGALDLESADRLVEFCLEEGVHGFTLLGVMGEAPKLSLEEQAAFTNHVLKRIDGRVPVIVGVSNPGMDNLEALSKSAMDAGAGGVMIAGMPGLKTDEQVETYFQAVGDRLGDKIPICLQDYPPTTTVFISVPVVNRLIGKLPQLKMFKHEDCPGHRKLTRLREAPEDGVRRVSILPVITTARGRRRHHVRLYGHAGRVHRLVGDGGSGGPVRPLSGEARGRNSASGWRSARRCCAAGAPLHRPRRANRARAWTRVTMQLDGLLDRLKATRRHRPPAPRGPITRRSRARTSV